MSESRKYPLVSVLRDEANTEFAVSGLGALQDKVDCAVDLREEHPKASIALLHNGTYHIDYQIRSSDETLALIMAEKDRESHRDVVSHAFDLLREGSISERQFGQVASEVAAGAKFPERRGSLNGIYRRLESAANA